MGVLGWPPLTVMKEAGLDDLADAYEGYARIHGFFSMEPCPPSAQFLTGMIKRFPDVKASILKGKEE